MQQSAFEDVVCEMAAIIIGPNVLLVCPLYDYFMLGWRNIYHWMWLIMTKSANLKT